MRNGTMKNVSRGLVALALACGLAAAPKAAFAQPPQQAARAPVAGAVVGAQVAKAQPAPKVAAKPSTPAPESHTPAFAQAALKNAAQQSGMPLYQGTNGKLYVNPTQQHELAALESMSKPGSGVLQIIKTEGVQHTKVIFEGRMLHLQYATGSGNWRLRPWGDRLRPSSRRSWGALVQLTPAEAKNMRERLAAIEKEEGPEYAAGPNWVNGHIKTSLGVPSFNCASGWCAMPVGEKGENIGQITGVGTQGDPNSLERLLESNSTDRVFGVVVYGQKVPDFGQHPEQPQVKN